MAANSSFFPRLSFQRGESPVLPLHNLSSSVRRKPSEYDLSELSPRPNDEALSPEPLPIRKQFPSRRSSSPSVAYSDGSGTTGSASKGRQRVLFAGPPPPIASSRLVYRDEEEHASSPRNLGASTIARNINSVLFDRHSKGSTRDPNQEYEPDTAWRNLQRRERTLQKELQLLLDAQSVGLAATLDPSAAPPSTRSDASDAGSSTPTSALHPAESSTRRSHVTFEEPARVSSAGALIPVRQPRKRPISLRGARVGLAKNMMLLADLKTEEDATLASALSIRKRALAQLRVLSTKRAGIREELQALEAEDEEPLARELRQLGEEHDNVTTEITELEERLVGLRNRRRWLNGRMEDVRNRREAGLSGYKGALKDVEARVSTLLASPPIKPLDVKAIGGPYAQASENGSQASEEIEQSLGGLEFLRMRPERRTIEMAHDWWDSEVAILERRKGEVDRERGALEEGVEVWKGAVRLVNDFEAELRKEMKANFDGTRATGVSANSPEQAMYAQLAKMATVMSGLEERLHLAEEKGWNLLICAIGAELAAFQEAEHMLQEALHATGSEVDGRDTWASAGQGDHENDDGTTPRLGRSASNIRSAAVIQGDGVAHGDTEDDKTGGNLMHMRASEDEAAGESDNEVPQDLLVAQPEPPGSPALSREDSENEVPPEFLAQHHSDDEVE